MGNSPSILPRIARKVPPPHDVGRDRLHHRIEKMSACLKGWRRVATRHDRCPIPSLSACALAATVIHWQ